jgi:hypothetical protein
MASKTGGTPIAAMSKFSSGTAVHTHPVVRRK